MKKLLFLISIIVLSGCSLNTVNFEENSKKISADKSVYVALPYDGSYNGKIYENSGKEVQQKIVADMMIKSKEVQFSKNSMSLDDNLHEAKSKKMDYLVYPQIEEWEDHYTRFSSQKDKVALTIEVYNAPNKELLNKAALLGTGDESGCKGNWWANPPPECLLGKMMQKYLEDLYE